MQMSLGGQLALLVDVMQHWWSADFQKWPSSNKLPCLCIIVHCSLYFCIKMQRLTVDLEKNATELSSKVFNPSFNNTCTGRSTGSSCRGGNRDVIRVLNMPVAVRVLYFLWLLMQRWSQSCQQPEECLFLSFTRPEGKRSADLFPP